MKIGTPPFQYEWREDWVKIPDTASGKTNGRTHGVVVSESGEVIVFHQASPAVLVYSAEGKLLRSFGDRFDGAHGLTLVKEGKHEYLWLTDQGTTEVVKMDLHGKQVLNIEKPGIVAYREGKYSPTWVAVNEERFGGNGDIWVADGYGSSLVHRYDKNGDYLQSISGAEGSAGPFKCPHGIWMDTRKKPAELYVADRGNKRVQVYDLEGNWKRAFGSDFLGSPCGFVTLGENLYIPELRASVKVLDQSDKLVATLGENEKVCDLPGWPNHEKKLIEAGKFNSPHGMAVDPKGNIYVVEWIVGGRITRLEKV
ncbi:MAG: hypothetical protein JNM63_14725 [Spirochaetia bacterium]|nr:hypothetical protein [Spirochaetia bacterium]